VDEHVGRPAGNASGDRRACRPTGKTLLPVR
jgi:hypothetical protein